MSQFLMDTNAESPAAPPRLPKTRGLHGVSSTPKAQGGRPAHISIESNELICCTSYARKASTRCQPNEMTLLASGCSSTL